MSDIIICTGDFSIWGTNIVGLIDKFKRFDKTILILHGNHESEKDVREIASKNNFLKFMHRFRYEFNNCLFYGFGGGGFSEIEPLLEKDIPQLGKDLKLKAGQRLITMSHAPPYDTMLDIVPGIGHRGCKSVRKLIDTFQPALHICGHLHENFSKVHRLGNTMIINPGPDGKILRI
jgi:uncharacterized protein